MQNNPFPGPWTYSSKVLFFENEEILSFGDPETNPLDISKDDAYTSQIQKSLPERRKDLLKSLSNDMLNGDSESLEQYPGVLEWFAKCYVDGKFIQPSDYAIRYKVKPAFAKAISTKCLNWLKTGNDGDIQDIRASSGYRTLVNRIAAFIDERVPKTRHVKRTAKQLVDDPTIEQFVNQYLSQSNMDLFNVETGQLFMDVLNKLGIDS
jgi:hypothetical protein